MLFPMGGDHDSLVEGELRKIPSPGSEGHAEQSAAAHPPVYVRRRAPAQRTMQPPDFEDAFDIIVEGLLQARKKNVGRR